MDALITYTERQHAKLFERYNPKKREFVEVGDSTHEGQIDPDTGAEYKAIAREGSKYLKDYKVGASYPENIFIYARHNDEESLSHDELEQLLDENGLWHDNLKPVILPKPSDEWWYAFYHYPIETKPRLDRVEELLEDRVNDEFWVYYEGDVVEANLTTNDE